jgi:hypothetical protein
MEKLDEKKVKFGTARTQASARSVRRHTKFVDRTCAGKADVEPAGRVTLGWTELVEAWRDFKGSNS